MSHPQPDLSRRKFLGAVSLAAAGLAMPQTLFARQLPKGIRLAPLAPFDYGDVTLASEPHEKQLAETHKVLMGLSDDSLLKPLRLMSGQAAPGEDIGGWYRYNPNYKYGDPDGFAPSCTFGQWVSALARMYAITGDEATRQKVLRLNQLYAKTISGEYYDKNRFPTYCYDKIVRGLVDSHKYCADPDAFAILNRTTDTALPHFPGHAVEHGIAWRPDTDFQWTWDESYTISENLFIAYQSGAGKRYRELGRQYLDDIYYDPLAQGWNDLTGRHAYSHVNSLGSAMQAYFTLGSEKHFHAAQNGFDMLAKQSFATGGWGPDETLCAPGSADLFNSLTNTHASFETPCGSYAHFKLTRYLLQVTRDARYGDSMERVMYNTVLGAKPLMPDGRTFYYSDYNFKGTKYYRDNQHWSCCSGTLPQVAADYRINTYFRDPNGVWVNLYIPSTLRWKQNGADIVLNQSSQYPYEGAVQFDLQISRAREFALNFRIPAWAAGASLSINGRRTTNEIIPGTFASIHREWNNGDRVELDLPMTTRLEPIDPQHPDTVALLHGPLVLFAITNAAPSVTRANLLAAKRTGNRSWEATTSGSPLKLLPFVEIANEPYSTYLRINS